MTSSRNTKVVFCTLCLVVTMVTPAPKHFRYPPPPAPMSLDIIDMAAISRMNPHQLEALAEGLAVEEMMRTKRSSAQALTSVVSKASSGIQGKVGLLGQASALIASASSKSGHEGYSYEPHEEKVDYWGLKKSILNTLFQAVKAITGGVTILKGQLIKGGGHLAVTLGKVIAVKGDTVSNFGKKIVQSAALSPKKPSHPPVYGPPPAHIDYPPSAYGAPTAPAHYTHTGHTGPSAPSGFGAHKYPASLDGRGKLNGVHAGLVLLAPLDGSTSETNSASASYDTGHTQLEPPSSFIHTAFSAIKNALSPATAHEPDLTHQPPPPPQPVPPFRPMVWGAVNSYGEPATVDSYTDYDPRNSHPPLDHASSKLSVSSPPKSHGLTPEKLHKLTNNLNKLTDYMHNNIQRSSEDHAQLNSLDTYRDMVMRKQLPLFPTPVVTDHEVGVLPAALLPTDPTTTTTTTTTTTSTTTTTTTPPPTTSTDSEVNRRKKDLKYILRGNRIVQV